MAVRDLVDIILRSDSESVFAWAACIEASARRERSLTQTITNWLNTDPDAACAAVERAHVPEALPASLL